MINDGMDVRGLPKAPSLANPAPRLAGINRTAIASLVCACLLCSLIGTPLAIVLGHVARHQIKRYDQDGGGLAIAGLVIGYISVVSWVTLIVVITTRPR